MVGRGGGRLLLLLLLLLPLLLLLLLPQLLLILLLPLLPLLPLPLSLPLLLPLLGENVNTPSELATGFTRIATFWLRPRTHGLLVCLPYGLHAGQGCAVNWRICEHESPGNLYSKCKRQRTCPMVALFLLKGRPIEPSQRIRSNSSQLMPHTAMPERLCFHTRPRLNGRETWPWPSLHGGWPGS